MPRMDPGDAELLAAWRAGDDASGNKLIERHFAVVYRFFARRVDDAIEDLTQRTFLACVESKDRVREEGSFRAFLLAIARHQLFDHLRRTGGGRLEIEALSGLATEHSLGGAVALRAEHRRLLGAVGALPPEHQAVVELHYWEELTTHEVAGVLGIPVGTVRWRLVRAREILRERLVDRAAQRSADDRAPASGDVDRFADALSHDLDGADE
jgi:RNA polymerase sigma-70 factor (ECF subfamily)